MRPLGQTSPDSSWKVFFRSYGSDLRGWAGGITARYGIAVALCLAGTASLISSGAVGFAALFRWLAIIYGPNEAYAIVGGLLAFLGLLSFLIAVLLFKQSLPPLPRPHGHARQFGRSVAARAVLIPSSGRSPLRADATTEILAGAAAVLLIGWLAASRFDRKPRAEDE